ncbi:MAG: hypothetical protein M1838_000001 [Thelocarpon superellum]|nr:MAG: hypothetical protein M1838_000001 [Thelocarpon superellum]
MSLHPPSRAHRCSGRQRYCLPHKLNTTVVPRPELRCAACQSWELKMRDRARARARARGIPCGTEDEKQRVVRDEPRAQAMMQVPNSLDMRGFEDEHHETEEAEEADEAEEDTTLLSGFRD